MANAAHDLRVKPPGFTRQPSMRLLGKIDIYL